MVREQGSNGRANCNGDDQTERAESCSLKADDEHQRECSDRDRGQMHLANVHQQIECPGNTVGSDRVVAGEVAELTEDRVHTHAGDEPDHHGPRDEAQQ